MQMRKREDRSLVTRRAARRLLLLLTTSASANLLVSTPAQAQLSETRQSSGLQTVFSYKIETRYGTNTSVTVSGSTTGKAEAVLNLKSGSKVTNKIGDESGNASAVFVATPTGGNVDLKGITGENMFLIDDGTSFKSSVIAPEGDPNATNTGTASAYATHSTSVIVEKGTSSFQSGFEQTF